MFKRIRIIIGLVIIFIAYVVIITAFKSTASMEDYIGELVTAYIMAEGLMYLGGFIGLGIRGYFASVPVGTRILSILITPIVTVFVVFLMIREFFNPS